MRRLLIKNIHAVLPGDEDLPTVRCCHIGVEGARIAFVLAASDAPPPEFLPDKVIDGTDRLVIPGLVNAHTHAYMTIFRNRADDLPFTDWLFGHILPMEDKLRPGDCYWGTLLAACEMLKSGTTCYNDMYISVEENARACAESGLRAVLARGLIGDSYDDPGGVKRLEDAVGEIEAFRGAGEGRLQFALAPHAPYTCAPDYLRRVAETARRLGVGIHTHLGESRDEIKGIAEKYGKTPFALMEETGLFDLPTVAAHCVYMTDADMEICARNRVCVATNPVSNLKLANGVAPVPRMLAAGVAVALGTDGTASNNSLNMLREMSFLCLLHKGVNEDALCVPAAQGLHIATQGGANALGLGAETGSIAPGKKADLAILNMAGSHWAPHANLIAALAYSANGSEVETVLVNGEILLESGCFTRLDEERIRWEVQRISDRITG